MNQRKGTNVPEKEKHGPVYIVLQNPILDAVAVEKKR
jgi:hypothetical protein